MKRTSVLRTGVRARGAFFREAVSRGGPVIYACGGAVSLALGWTIVGALKLPMSWAVVLAALVFALIVFEGGYRANARLRAALAEWEARAVSLPGRLDALIREGAALVHELPQRAPIPEQANGFTVPMVPDASHAERVDAFDARVRELLMEHRPSLLPVYSDGINVALARAREWEESRARSIEEHGDNAAKLKEFTDREHRQPVIQLEALLAGLSEARNRLGH